MTDKQKGNILIAFALIGFIGLIWAIYETILNKYYLSKDYRFAITTKISYGAPSKTGAKFKYYFVVKSNSYAGFTSSNLNTDSTYFVKYYPPNPERNEATVVVANQNDIQNLPIDGYRQLPHK